MTLSVEKTRLNSSKSDLCNDRTIVIVNDVPEISNDDPERDAVSMLPRKPQERYKFIRSIGFGGMKGVLLVEDKDTGREIAMAIMPDFRDRPRRDLNRFVREAQITAQLEHPNIVPIHDIGIDASGSPYFTMKYLRGQTLAMILRQKHNGKETGYSLEKLLQVLLRVCNAIAFAHSKGICHLDLKPANIHCGDFGEVQVLDWGLAAAESDCDNGILQGTPGYMSPEFIRSGGKVRPGPEADIYAIGATLYAILTNDSPFAGLPQQEVLRRTVEGKLPPPSEINEAIDPGLEAICMKAMATDPAERYQSIIELRQEIKANIAGFPTRAENPSDWRRAMLYIKRHLSDSIIILLLLIIALLTFILLKG